MSEVNQRGERVIERHIYMPDASPYEVQQVLAQLIERMSLHVVETNATKHGNTEIQLRSDFNDH